MPIAFLTRKVAFAAAHRYHRPDWSEEENRRVFGPSSRPHGHNYVLEATVGGEIDPASGFCVDLGRLDEALRREVLEAFDHQDLNAAVAEFGPGRAIPTSEVILAHLWPRLAAALPAGARLHRLRLHEDSTFHVDYFGGEDPPAP